MAGIPMLQKELSRLTGGGTARLSAAVDDVDKMIEVLTAARDQIAHGLSTQMRKACHETGTWRSWPLLTIVKLRIPTRRVSR